MAVILKEIARVERRGVFPIVYIITRGMASQSKNRTGGDLVDDLEAKFFDDRIGEDFLGHAFGLREGVFAGEAVEIDDEELALTDVFDGAEAKTGKGVLDGLTLGIENGALRHDPDVCFHGGIITKLPGEASRHLLLKPS